MRAAEADSALLAPPSWAATLQPQMRGRSAGLERVVDAD
jgi:hypothetical protein